ncbi:MAG: hypothetical protein AUH39_02225 [Chloroflexi bacterium 13_1_40CM_67_9]|nr:MAG: hypothetical protein AUH39_02225 [Chloroflexi bacterium 13_1_40CM_67_9]
MLRSDTRSAFQYALVIFTLTALLGLANATQLFGALDRNTLLTHLHSGTLGWITMGVIGLTLWMFGGRGLNTAVRISALAAAAYVLAFWSGNFQARAIFGLSMLGVVYGWWWFVVYRGMADGWGSFDIPRLSVLFGLTTLVIGSTLGVIVQVILGTGNSLPTTPDLVGAHASAQVGGYLILVAAGFIEWQLTGGGKRTAAGLAQVALLFVGGLILSISFLLAAQLPATAQQALPGIATLFTLVGAIIVVVRLGRAALAVSWAAGGKRHIALATGYLVAGVVLFALLVQQFIAAQNDPSKVSIGLLHSVDHVYFVGLMTNILFGAILVASADRPRVWPWADQVIFWGLNIGIASFVAVLLTQGSGEGAKPFASAVAYTAPIMGLSALLGIVTFSMRLMASPQTMRAPAPA